MGNALLELGDLDAAMASYRVALQLRSNYPEAQKNLGMAELQFGDFQSGWIRYEYRFQVRSEISPLDAIPVCPRWDGRALGPDQRLLLVAEQGIGDTFQFMRYVLALKDQGFSVTLCAQAKLHSLIKASGIDSAPLTPEQASQISDGYWSPLLSVPGLLNVTSNNPIIAEPYIKTTVDLHQKWKQILAVENRPVIAINWQGNPKYEKTNSVGRSLPLDTFAAIANQLNVSLLSLQKGFGSEQLDTCSFRKRFVGCQDTRASDID
jgi:tetratricopeptide (TPR) repeat protein